MARLLLERGANVNAPAGDKINALDWAAHRGLENVVRFLLEHGADASDLMRTGALNDQSLASCNDVEELVQLLLRKEDTSSLMLLQPGAITIPLVSFNLGDGTVEINYS